MSATPQIDAMLERARQQVARVIPNLQKHFEWFDTFNGFKAGKIKAVECRYGVVTYLGVAEVQQTGGGGEVVLRESVPKNHRLIGALDPGATALDCDEFAMFLYETARVLGGERPIEATNTLLTTYPLSSLIQPGFKTVSGIVITLVWPYKAP